jgi:hypothetical protein
MKKRYLGLVLVFGLFLSSCALGGSETLGAGEPAPGSDGAPADAGSVGDVLAEVELLTGESGLGEKPLLQWSDIEGAAEYSLVVRDEAGKVYWAWRGAETEVPFGGGADDGQAGQNAYLHETMSWIVIAFDDSLVPIAISGPGSLSP